MLGRAHCAADDLDRCGFVGRPSWEALKAGARPPAPEVTEPGEWLHGWQHHASSSCEFHYRERPWCCHSRRLPTRPTFGRIQVQARTKCNLCYSEHCFSRGPDYRSTVRVRVSVGQAGPTSEPARDQAGCVRGHCQSNEHWHESAERSRGLRQVQSSIA